MSAFVVALARIDIKTIELQAYIDKSEQLALEYGGKYIIRGSAEKVAEGNQLLGRSLVVLEFKTLKKAESFFFSEAYQKEIKPLRNGTGVYDVGLYESP
jgi:uncharacterized protein (DUF1330 family)